MGKKAGYLLFGFVFIICRIFPVNMKKVFFIATHDDGPEGNIGIVYSKLKKKHPDFRFFRITKKDGLNRPFAFFTSKAFHLATSGTVFLDNTFMPMAYTPFSKKTRVVQLWHGALALKHYGLDSETGEVAEIARKGNERYTHVIVESEMSKKQSVSAFGLPQDRIHVLGLPRTDYVLWEKRKGRLREKAYEKFPELRGKKCILYAPTFRDGQEEDPTLPFDVKAFSEKLAGDEILLLKLHPYVADNFVAPKDCQKVLDVSKDLGVTTALSVSDCLISDYSSIIFEYALFGRPMIFYAYDLDEFEKNGRGFYMDYSDFVPGAIVKTEDELLKAVQNRENIGFGEVFLEKTHRYTDEKAVERIFELLTF